MKTDIKTCFIVTATFNKIKKYIEYDEYGYCGTYNLAHAEPFNNFEAALKCYKTVVNDGNVPASIIKEEKYIVNTVVEQSDEEFILAKLSKEEYEILKKHFQKT